MHFAQKPPAASGLINFVNASPSPFHAVASAAKLLEDAGFVKIREQDEWENDVEPGGSYYFTRNELAVVAFTLPDDWQPGRGLSMVATHLDSPSLRVRPVSKKSAEGYLQVGVETYGGGIWHTWIDRDLSVAGRVVIKDASSGAFRTRLVKVDRPLLRIPSLAVHLDGSVNSSFSFNRETQFVPILGLVSSESSRQQDDPAILSMFASDNHHAELLEAVADDLGVRAADIEELELALYDTQPATLGGAKNEFVFSPRLDNQFSTFCATQALVESVSSTKALSRRNGNVNVIMLFNHEEIGSVSTSGAQSSLAKTLIERLSPGAGLTARSIAKSFLISSDVGHAVHPSYPSKHERNHKPVLNGGVAIKTNAGQRYTSEGVGTFIVKQLAASRGGTLQQYEVPNDITAGSTVGPHLSTIGMRTIDVGAPILSMHSIREQAGVDDVQALVDLFGAFFESYTDVAAKLQVD
ncbi:peptidase M18, aminopeptidase I [Exidia glandulosa HHB12029]|uniref:aspartyl aminopeptidase n=1 Tax=Exidia glandulosa HHB12029 TaxID=1314781 RepID=A0A165EYL7_EXIGL|nr:peptidase M18, aminopeptidase I [Exidia glandulosa HHB12029]